MITWDVIILFPFTILSYALTIFFSISVAIGAVMVKVLIWVYQYSSLLLVIFSIIWQLLIWLFTAIWILIYVVIAASSVVGKVLFTSITTTAQYGYHGLSYLPYGIYSIAVLSYNVVTSLTVNGWVIMKDSIWPAVMQCAIFIISMVIYMINVIYNLLTTLGGFMVDIGMLSLEFIRHTVAPFIVSVFYHLLYGVMVIFDHCYSIIMTVLHYITAMVLRIIETLPGVVQPLASDIVYYGSDIVATVIGVVFNVLRWTVTSGMDVTELLVTTPAFWAILLTAILLYHCYTRHWHVTDRLTVAPVERREIRRERNNSLQSNTKQNQSSVTTGQVEADSDVTRRKKEKFEEEMLCVVCQYEKKTILLQPCNHLCLCHDCVEPVLADNRICPMCRKHVQQWTKVYL